MFEHFQDTIETVEFLIKLKDGTSYTMKEGGLIGANKRKTPDEEVVKRVIGIKDKFQISDAAYHELHMISSELPSLHYIKPERQRLALAFTILEPFPASKPSHIFIVLFILYNTDDFSVAYWVICMLCYFAEY